MIKLLLCSLLAAGFGAAESSPQRLDDVVRNLRNPDYETRLRALRTLREARHVEAIAAIAPLINDPADAIQLEAIATELSFFLIDHVEARRRVALIVESRRSAQSEAAFDAGSLAVWPRPVPPELVMNLLRAVDDATPKVRHEAIYAVGVIGREPLTEPAAQLLINALDHYDPVVRAGASRVTGRLRVTSAGPALLKGVNDSQEPVRFASMRALGDLKEQTASEALARQLAHYRRGEGAWSAIDGLAKIGNPASVPVFKSRLADRDQYIRRAAIEGLGRAGDTTSIAALEAALTNDSSEIVRVASAFALQKLGRNNLPRLVESLDSEKTAQQVAEYLIELGPAVADALVTHLRHPKAEIRGNVGVVLGAIGTASHVPPLAALAKDRDRDVVRAAGRAIERIRMRGA